MIFGRILGIGQIIARVILLQFSPEAFWRLEEMSELRGTTPEATLHKGLVLYEELVKARLAGYKQVVLTTESGKRHEVDLDALLAIY
jgi:hypothetical protein